MMDDEKSETTPQAQAADYDIGYGKAPPSNRFAKGRSGNPSGKRKEPGSKLPAMNEEKLKKLMMEEAYRTIKINDGDRQVDVPMAQAILRSLAVAAVKGQLHAQALFIRLLSTVEQQNKALHDEWFNTALEYKIRWEKILLHRKQTGTTGPEPVPHPDHLVVDMIAGTIRIAGPMTKEEKAALNAWQNVLMRKAGTCSKC